MAGQLTVTAVRKLARVDGKHRVAPGLYLRVRGPSASWIFRAMVDGRDRDLSLGPFESISLAEAAAKAAELRLRVKRGEGVAVFGARAQAAAAAEREDTFRRVAEIYIETKRAGWKNAKHAAQWSSTLETYAYPRIGEKPVADITADHVLDVLLPIWVSKNETALRLRGRIESILDAARVRGLRSGPNPATYQGNLELLLPEVSRRARIVHHAAMAWRNLPAFMSELRQRANMSAWALQCTILTACRTGEVIGARWPEIDLDGALWAIPAARMKARREHRVPLSPQAVELLRALPRMDESDMVFWGARKPTISNMAMLELLRGMRPGLTVHGFRSAFRDWAAENTTFPAEVVEMALAHTIANQVEAAYRRGDLLEKRRELMQAWSDYLGKSTFR